MATNEAVIVELGPNGGAPVQFTCASGTAIKKGTILKFADPRTASKAAGKFDKVAGIAAADKAADDYSTTIAVYQEGIFDLTCWDGTVTAGDFVGTSGENFIISGIASGQNLLGVALETGSAMEVIQVKLVI